MTDREKVALVAEKVMGWTVNRSERGWHTIGVTPKRLIGPSKCRLPGDCWNPWERIEHAWEVVEKMVTLDWSPFVEFDNEDGLWFAHFLKYDPETTYNTGEQVNALANAAPEAISLAALRAKGVEV